MLGCPGSLVWVWASTHVVAAAAPFPTRPRLCSPWGVRGWGGVPAALTPPPLQPPPQCQAGEATQRCPAQVGQEASFAKVLVSFLLGGEGEQKRSFFHGGFSSLYVDTKRNLNTGPCSDVEWFPDKQQPPGTEGLK